MVCGAIFLNVLSLYLQLIFWCRIWLSTDRSLMAWLCSHLLGKYLLFPCIVTDFSEYTYICKTNQLFLMVCRLFVCYWLLLIRRTCIWSQKKGSSSYCSSFGILETYKFVAAHLSLQNPSSIPARGSKIED